MNSPSVSANIEALPSISSLPVLSPMSNIPSVTTSFIIDQMVNLPPQSPQNISSPRLTRRTRTERQIQSTNVRPRHVIKKKKIDLKFRWSNGRFQHYAELEPDEFQSPIPDNKCAYDYFSDFFSEDLFAEICQYSNMYAMQLTGQSINLTVEELRNFISIKVIMGIVSMPSYLDYWSTTTRYPLVADVMSLKRYQQIRRYIHFVDNNETNSDPYFKIRPFAERIRQNCLKVEEETRFSIDEMVIPYKGTKAGKKRQYNPQKPRKWGFKNLVRAGASGLIYDFFLYAGHESFENCPFTDEEESLGWGGKAVIRLCKTIKKKPCVVYFDNFFSSLELIYHLRNSYGIFSLGTIRAKSTQKCCK
ncbi:piggyBac transposable element-derived protein 2-like [Trichoplusia ni]|uniref:PiggyBac transposable element-derived protein 2-like n=1 Tax=Trichoplusia ni TaxID=7111 RepID=A0A7E5X0E7_TRINI|nr:piggyBac transposable element-derived protein 2-like [Trichoplusia ni]